MLSSRDLKLPYGSLELLQMITKALPAHLDLRSGGEHLKSYKCQLRQFVFRTDTATIERWVVSRAPALRAQGFERVRVYLDAGFVGLQGHFCENDSEIEFHFRLGLIANALGRIDFVPFDLFLFTANPSVFPQSVLMKLMASLAPELQLDAGIPFLSGACEKVLREVLPVSGWKIPSLEEADVAELFVTATDITFVVRQPSASVSMPRAKVGTNPQAYYVLEQSRRYGHIESRLCSNADEVFSAYRHLFERGESQRWSLFRMLQIGPPTEALGQWLNDQVLRGLEEGFSGDCGRYYVLQGLLRSQDWDEAEALLFGMAERAAEQSFSRGSLHFRLLAAQLAEQRQPQEGLEKYRSILVSEPDSLLGLHGCFRTLLRLGEWAEVAGIGEKLSRLVRDDGEREEILTQLAKVYTEELSQPRKARVCLERVLRFAPASENALTGLARVFCSRGEPQRALTYLVQLADRAMEAGNQDSMARGWYEMGLVWAHHLKEARTAAEYFERAIEAVPDHFSAWFQRLTLAREHEGSEAAKTLFEKFFELPRERLKVEHRKVVVWAHEIYGLEQRKEGELEKALFHLEESLRLGDSVSEILPIVVEILVEQEAWDRAARLIEVYAQRCDERNVYQELMRLLISIQMERLHNPQAAQENIEKLREEDRDDIELFELLCSVVSLNGDAPRLAQILEDACSRETRRDRVVQLLGQLADLYKDAPQLEDELELRALQRLYELAPSSEIEERIYLWVRESSDIRTRIELLELLIGQQQGPEPGNRYKKELSTAYAETVDYERAIPLGLQYLKANPKDLEQTERVLDWLRLDENETRKNKYLKVLLKSNELVELQNRIHRSLADSHKELESWTEAIGHLSELRGPEINSEAIHHEILELLLKGERFEEAARRIELWALNDDGPASGGALLTAVDYYERANASEKALRLLKQVVSRRSFGSYEAAHRVESLAETIGDEVLRCQAIRWEWELAPDSRKLAHGERLAGLFVEQKSWKEAESLCGTLLKQDQTLKHLTFYLGLCSQELSNYTEAYEHWLEWLRGDPLLPASLTTEPTAHLSQLVGFLIEFPGIGEADFGGLKRQYGDAFELALSGQTYSDILRSQQSHENLAKLKACHLEASEPSERPRIALGLARLLSSHIGDLDRAKQYYVFACSGEETSLRSEARRELEEELRASGQENEYLTLAWGWFFEPGKLAEHFRYLASIYTASNGQRTADDWLSLLRHLAKHEQASEHIDDFRIWSQRLNGVALFAEVLEESLRRRPNLEDGRFSELISLYLGPLSDPGRAIRTLDLAIEEFPYLDLPHRRLVGILREQAEKEKLQRAYTRWAALREGGERGEILFEYLRWLDGSGLEQEALLVLLRLASSLEYQAEFHEEVTARLRKSGSPEQLVGWILHIANVVHEDERCHVLLLEAARVTITEDLDPALLNQIVSQTKETSELLETVVAAYRECGKLLEASLWLRRLISKGGIERYRGLLTGTFEGALAKVEFLGLAEDLVELCPTAALISPLCEHFENSGQHSRALYWFERLARCQSGVARELTLDRYFNFCIDPLNDWVQAEKAIELSHSPVPRVKRFLEHLDQHQKYGLAILWTRWLIRELPLGAERNRWLSKLLNWILVSDSPLMPIANDYVDNASLNEILGQDAMVEALSKADDFLPFFQVVTAKASKVQVTKLVRDYSEPLLSREQHLPFVAEWLVELDDPALAEDFLKIASAKHNFASTLDFAAGLIAHFPVRERLFGSLFDASAAYPFDFESAKLLLGLCESSPYWVGRFMARLKESASTELYLALISSLMQDNILCDPALLIQGISTALQIENVVYAEQFEAKLPRKSSQYLQFLEYWLVKDEPGKAWQAFLSLSPDCESPIPASVAKPILEWGGEQAATKEELQQFSKHCARDKVDFEILAKQAFKLCEVTEGLSFLSRGQQDNEESISRELFQFSLEKILSCAGGVGQVLGLLKTANFDFELTLYTFEFLMQVGHTAGLKEILSGAIKRALGAERDVLIERFFDYALVVNRDFDVLERFFPLHSDPGTILSRYALALADLGENSRSLFWYERALPTLLEQQDDYRATRDVMIRLALEIGRYGRASEIATEVTPSENTLNLLLAHALNDGFIGDSVRWALLLARSESSEMAWRRVLELAAGDLEHAQVVYECLEHLDEISIEELDIFLGRSIEEAHFGNLFRLREFSLELPANRWIDAARAAIRRKNYSSARECYGAGLENSTDTLRDWAEISQCWTGANLELELAIWQWSWGGKISRSNASVIRLQGLARWIALGCPDAFEAPESISELERDFANINLLNSDNLDSMHTIVSHFNIEDWFSRLADIVLEYNLETKFSKHILEVGIQSQIDDAGLFEKVLSYAWALTRQDLARGTRWRHRIYKKYEWFEQLLEVLSELLEVVGEDHTSLHMERVEILTHLGRLTAARDELEQIPPNERSTSWIELSYTLSLAGDDFERAVADAKLLAEGDKEVRAAYWFRVAGRLMWWTLGRFDEGLSLLQQAHRIAPACVTDFENEISRGEYERENLRREAIEILGAEARHWIVPLLEASEPASDIRGRCFDLASHWPECDADFWQEVAFTFTEIGEPGYAIQSWRRVYETSDDSVDLVLESLESFNAWRESAEILEKELVRVRALGENRVSAEIAERLGHLYLERLHEPTKVLGLVEGLLFTELPASLQQVILAAGLEAGELTDLTDGLEGSQLQDALALLPTNLIRDFICQVEYEGRLSLVVDGLLALNSVGASSIEDKMRLGMLLEAEEPTLSAEIQLLVAQEHPDVLVWSEFAFEAGRIFEEVGLLAEARAAILIAWDKGNRSSDFYDLGFRLLEGADREQILESYLKVGDRHEGDLDEAMERYLELVKLKLQKPDYDSAWEILDRIELLQRSRELVAYRQDILIKRQQWFELAQLRHHEILNLESVWDDDEKREKSRWLFDYYESRQLFGDAKRHLEALFALGFVSIEFVDRGLGFAVNLKSNEMFKALLLERMNLAFDNYDREQVGLYYAQVWEEVFGNTTEAVALLEGLFASYPSVQLADALFDLLGRLDREADSLPYYWDLVNGPYGTLELVNECLSVASRQADFGEMVRLLELRAVRFEAPEEQYHSFLLAADIADEQIESFELVQDFLEKAMKIAGEPSEAGTKLATRLIAMNRIAEGLQLIKEGRTFLDSELSLVCDIRNSQALSDELLVEVRTFIGARFPNSAPAYADRYHYDYDNLSPDERYGLLNRLIDSPIGLTRTEHYFFSVELVEYEIKRHNYLRARGLCRSNKSLSDEGFELRLNEVFLSIRLEDVEDSTELIDQLALQLEHLRGWVNSQPSSGHSRYFYVLAYVQQFCGNLREAAAAYEFAIRAPSGVLLYDEALKFLRNYYLETANFERYLELLEYIVDSFDQVTEGHALSVEIGQLYWERFGDARNARKHLNKAFEQDPSNIELRRWLGEISFAEGIHIDAIFWLEPLRKDAPGLMDATLLCSLCECYVSMEMFADAIEVVDEFMGRFKATARILELRASAEEALGLRKALVETLIAYLSFWEGDSVTGGRPVYRIKQLACLYLDDGDLVSAEGILKDAVENSGEGSSDLEILGHLRRIYLEEGRWESALEVVSREIPLTQDLGRLEELYLLLDRLAADEMGELEIAIVGMNEALRKLPESARIHHTRMKRYDEAGLHLDFVYSAIPFLRICRDFSSIDANLIERVVQIAAIELEDYELVVEVIELSQEILALNHSIYEYGFKAAEVLGQHGRVVAYGEKLLERYES
ncbi:MAG: hypothetical protein VYA34_12190 [Myxococcota bacterium]|nr:hypothetical protein [Myxococcota bacterium]